MSRLYLYVDTAADFKNAIERHIDNTDITIVYDGHQYYWTRIGDDTAFVQDGVVRMRVNAAKTKFILNFE